MYKQLKNIDGTLAECIKKDNLTIPFDLANTDYQAYLAWLDEGNKPLPADK